MYNKLDLFHFEFLISAYSLALLYFGSEYNYRYLAYQNAYLMAPVYTSFGLVVLLGYVITIGSIFPANKDECFADFNLTSLFFLPTLFILGLTLLAYLSYASIQKVSSFEYICFLFWSLLGLTCLVKSNDLLLVYLGMELSSFGFYVLTTYKRDSSYATEAGLKYFLLGAVASGNLLFGIVLFYASGATTNYQLLESLVFGLESFSGEVLLQQLALVFLLLSFLFKLASFPFHSWSIDVYDGGPLFSVVFLNSAPKLAFFFLLAKSIFILGICNLLTASTILILAGTFSIIWGALAGLKQKRLKRLLAVSGVGNIGFSLVGLATGTLQGLVGSLFYLLSYVLTTLICWFLLLSYRGTNGYGLARNFVDMRALSLKIPATATVTALLFLSFAGLPPFIGFSSKLIVISALVNSSLFLWAVIIVLFSFFSVFYYLRISKIVFFEAVQDQIKNIQFDSISSWIIAWLFLTFITISIYPQLFGLLNLLLGLNLIL